MKMRFTSIPMREWAWRLLLIAMLILPCEVLFAQGITVSGTVLDENKSALPGVNVIIKGTTNGTATGVDGKYSINVPDGSGTLVFSFIGFMTQEAPVNNRSQIDIILLPDVQTLSEVMVVGYGTQRKTDLTGAITSVRGEAIRELPVVSLEQAISGRLAGVQVQQSSGQPGGGISIRVRGVSSFAGGNEPLYVIDGIPQFNDDVRGANGLATINPSDIESIDVLKDAAAAAIYGSRAANGVVIITTKSGKAGTPRITFESTVGWQQVRKKLEMLNRQEYLDYSRNFYTNSGATIPNDLETYAVEGDTDWQDEVFQTAPQFNNNLSISGGNDHSKFFFSGGLLDQKGIVMNTGYKRGSIRINMDNKLGNKFTLQSRLIASRGIQNGFAPAVGDNTRNFGKSGVGSILRSLPVVPVKNPDGSYTDTTPFASNGIDAENPVAVAKEVTDRATTTRIQGGIDLKVEIIKGLSNTARVGGDFYHTRRDLYFPRILPRMGNNIGAAELNQYDKTSAVLEDFIEYKYDISEGSYVEAILGGSLQRERFNSMEVKATGFASDAMENSNLNAASSVSKPVSDVQENTIVSSFARVRVNLKEKYLFAASVRRDGSSVFAHNNKFGVFPSVSAGWRISEESFLNTTDLISTLKLRASWGQTGNPAIKPYQSLEVGRVVNTGQGAGAGLIVGLASTIPNEDLKWETTTQTNIGIDAGIKNEKYRLTFDYYIKTTSDLLAVRQLPPSAGVGAGLGTLAGQLLENVGSVENRGWELTIGANILNSADWTFGIDVNLSQNKNKVIETKNHQDVPSTGGNDASGSNSIIREGHPLFAFYGIKFTGVDENGWPMHENVDGNVDANGNPVFNALDNQIIGSPYPDLYYGINTSLKYKRLTFTTTWQGVSGSSINNVALFELTNPALANQFNKLKAVNEFYPNASTSITSAVTGVPWSYNRHIRSSRFMEDGTYFRLRNIRLDYNFNMGSNRVIRGLNIYASAQNLLTFTDYTGFDPEVNTFSGNDRRQGVDLGAYPGAKTYTLGFNITF